MDLQDTLSSTTESVRRAADLMDTTMQDEMEKILERIEHARKSTRSALSVKESFKHGMSRLFKYPKEKAAKEDEENASSPKETTDLDHLTRDAWSTLENAEKKLEETAKTIVEELGRVLVLIQVKLPFDKNLKFPDFGGVAKHLENLANELKAHAMEELEQLAENPKERVGDAAQNLMDDANAAGAGGLLDEVVGVFTDAVAEKRSEMEKWRVREVAAVCVKMLAAAPHIRGNLEDEVQGALVQRQALEIHDNVKGVMNLGSELPKRLAELATATTAGSKEEEAVAGEAKTIPKANESGKEEEEQKQEAAMTKVDVEGTVIVGDASDSDAAQCAMSMQKDAIAASLSKRMDELAALEEEARNETDGLKKGVLLAQCRMVRDLPLANCQDEFL